MCVGVDFLCALILLSFPLCSFAGGNINIIFESRVFTRWSMSRDEQRLLYISMPFLRGMGAHRLNEIIGAVEKNIPGTLFGLSQGIRLFVAPG